MDGGESGTGAEPVLTHPLDETIPESSSLKGLPHLFKLCKKRESASIWSVPWVEVLEFSVWGEDDGLLPPGGWDRFSERGDQRQHFMHLKHRCRAEGTPAGAWQRCPTLVSNYGALDEIKITNCHSAHFPFWAAFVCRLGPFPTIWADICGTGTGSSLIQRAAVWRDCAPAPPAGFARLKPPGGDLALWCKLPLWKWKHCVGGGSVHQPTHLLRNYLKSRRKKCQPGFRQSACS